MQMKPWHERIRVEKEFLENVLATLRRSRRALNAEGVLVRMYFASKVAKRAKNKYKLAQGFLRFFNSHDMDCRTVLLTAVSYGVCSLNDRWEVVWNKDAKIPAL